ncbi:MAG: ParB/RepB/Spo0J family partition protein [Oscillospiraceae bacterium]|jgi:ParB family chromosome partitioning protein|nr:ParB/RepB/Spo0J family partition protein [Oscillospiraceae bacterium]
MAVQKGLGRGLGALLGDFSQEAEADNGLKILPLQKVEPNPNQPRRDFDPEALEALSESIAQHGVLQPLTVRELESGYYQIIAGERRWRAARLAGLREIPAIVIEADDKKATELALIENLQREDLNPVEEAMGYSRLLKEYGMTQEDAAKRVGKSRPAVANALRLLQLTPEILEMVKTGALTPGHARAILSMKEPKKQKEAAQKIAALDLSVRQAELLCRNLNREPKPEPEAQPLAVDYIAECEKSLSRHLGRGVKIVNGKRKGRFELEFYGQEDLQRLLEILETLPKEANHRS